MPVDLTEKQKKHLRGLAHRLHPIVMVGQSGVSDAVSTELRTALAAHELVKVSVRVGDRDERDAILDTLASDTGATLVQRIGNVGVLYRRHPDKPRIVLPD